ncbi:MAG TPA: hypothetical protein VLH38_03165 [Patescibacteria group bacterium]|nr:hypothetical protein [Patescibacteria group bacterium]
MSKQRTNAMWASKRLDFNGPGEQTSQQIKNAMNAFLENTASSALAHSIHPAWR